MKIFGFNINRRVKISHKSAYQGAAMNRLTSDWSTAILSADAALRTGELCKLRARSRDLERNGGILERYLSALEANVIGSQGVQLQMKIRTVTGETASGPAGFDRAVNELVEFEWDEFGKKGNFDITGKHSRQDFWRLALRTAARDGDALVLIYQGGKVPNKWNIAFQLIEGDYLDDLYNDSRLPGGNSVRMGVELDPFKRKVAYWIFANHPGDYGVDGVYSYDGRRMRVPALGTEPKAPVHALHLTRCKRAEETRGVPWITPAMMAIRMLEGYEEAELIAARAQACKHVFFERNQFAPDGSPLDYGSEEPTGQLVEEVEPGAGTELPIGYHANFYNPTHPSQAFPEFTKSIKRKIASALNTAYNTLFVDLESVNYSSIRAGLLDEREEWKMKQSWLGDDLVLPSFDAWLRMQLMAGTFPGYGLLDLARLNAPEFKFRKWQWVDPLKDAEQAKLMLESKLTTRTRVMSDFSSSDFEETVDEIASENQYIYDAGLDPWLNEPRRSGQIIDSAEHANDPNADIGMETPPPNDRSARARAQARHPASGQFVAASAPKAAPKDELQGQIINVNVDAKAPLKKFKIKRPDGTVAEGEISYE